MPGDRMPGSSCSRVRVAAEGTVSVWQSVHGQASTPWWLTW